jgi:methionyl-tRNA formyltransferase
MSDNPINSSRLVLITSDEPEHHYVANRILREFDLVAIIVDRGRPQTKAERIRQLRKRYGPGQLFSRFLLRLTAKVCRDATRRHHDLLEIFGNGADGFARPDLVRYVDGINTDAGRAVVKETAADLLVVYGTGIIGKRVLDMAGQVALNLHTGMSPDYRGSDAVFWPIYNGDFHLVGATVHECTSRVDGGEIYERAPARIQPDDGLDAVFARCVEIGTELYITTIRQAIAGSLTGLEQDLNSGREYRAVDMRFRYDLHVRWLFRSGKVRRWAMSDQAR